MTRWFRFYDDAINDPKILKLPEAMRWHWTAVLCIASKYDGKLPALADVALLLRMTHQKAAATIACLVNAGLLDKDGDGFRPHNWDGRQYKSDTADPTAADRMRRYRRNHRNDRNDTVTVTPPRDREQNTEAETEKKETRARAFADDWPDDFREQFWTEYPNKVGKPKALAKLEGARKHGAKFADVMAGLRRYIADKPPDRSWLNPETFINQERWADQPAQTGPPIAAPRATTVYQQNQLDTREVLNELELFATGRSGSSQTDTRLLPGDSGERPEGLRGGSGPNVVDLSVAGHRAGR